MKTMLAVLALCALLVGCGTDDGSGSDAESSAPIKIGLLVPETGTGSAIGAPLSNSLTLAVDEINAAGGIDGRKVQVLKRDTASDPRVTVDQARELVERQKVDVMFGTILGTESLPARQVTESADRLFFFGSSGSSPSECTNYFVRLGQSQNQQIDPWVPELVKKYGPKFYVVANDFDYPHFVVDHLKEDLTEAGGELVGADYYPLGTTTYTTSMRKILNADPDVVFSVVVGGDYFALVKQFHQSGSKAQLASTGISDFTSGALKGALTGAEVDLSWTEALDTPENRKFVDAYKAKYGQDALNAPWGEAMYTGAYLYKLGVERAGTTDTDKVRQALTEVKFDAPQGEVSMVRTPGGLQMTTNSVIAKVNDKGQLEVEDVLGPQEWRNLGEYPENCPGQ